MRQRLWLLGGGLLAVLGALYFPWWQVRLAPNPHFPDGVLFFSAEPFVTRGNNGLLTQALDVEAALVGILVCAATLLCAGALAAELLHRPRGLSRALAASAAACALVAALAGPLAWPPAFRDAAEQEQEAYYGDDVEPPPVAWQGDRRWDDGDTFEYEPLLGWYLAGTGGLVLAVAAAWNGLPFAARTPSLPKG